MLERIEELVNEACGLSSLPKDEVIRYIFAYLRNGIKTDTGLRNLEIKNLYKKYRDKKYSKDHALIMIWQKYTYLTTRTIEQIVYETVVKKK